MKFVKGLYKSPKDSRDFLVTTLLKDKALPLAFSLRDKMPAVRHQGDEGSCAGFAGAYAKEYQEFLDTGKMMRFSPRFIYELAKTISGHNEGTTLKAIAEVLLKDGICYEKDWPYVANDVGSPSPATEKNAYNFRIKAYARVTTIEELKQIIYALKDNTAIKTVFCGLRLYKGAIGEQAKKSGVTPDPSCWDSINGAIGGHALTPVSWNDDSPYYNDGHIEFIGSWGEGFGNEGYHYFSYKNVRKNMLDALALVDIEGSEKFMTVGQLPIDVRKGIWV